MDFLKEFLETSTIHGLTYISRAPSKLSKLFWFLIVVAGFSFSFHLINSSYIEWQASPIATSISTHPISELDFPTVTVCPPEGSNTALNYDLARARNITLTDTERQTLINLAQQMLIDKPSNRHVELARALTDEENILELFEDKPSRTFLLPYPLREKDRSDNNLGYEILSSQLNGHFQTPGFGGKNSCQKDFDKIHFVLRHPLAAMDKATKNDTLEIEVKVQTNDGWLVQYRGGSKYRKYLEPKVHWHEAEELCEDKKGQLASAKNLLELKEMVPGHAQTNGSWIGGARIGVEKLWTWLDGGGCHLDSF